MLQHIAVLHALPSFTHLWHPSGPPCPQVPLHPTCPSGLPHQACLQGPPSPPCQARPPCHSRRPCQLVPASKTRIGKVNRGWQSNRAAEALTTAPVLPLGPSSPACHNSEKLDELANQLGNIIPRHCDCTGIASALDSWHRRTTCRALRSLLASRSDRTHLASGALGPLLARFARITRHTLSTSRAILTRLALRALQASIETESDKSLSSRAVYAQTCAMKADDASSSFVASKIDASRLMRHTASPVLPRGPSSPGKGSVGSQNSTHTKRPQHRRPAQELEQSNAFEQDESPVAPFGPSLPVSPFAPGFPIGPSGPALPATPGAPFSPALPSLPAVPGFP